MLVPKLRFKNFIDEWRNDFLKNICDFSKGNLLSKSDVTVDGKSCVLYGELYTKYNEVILEVYSKTGFQSPNLVYSKVNDILIPSSGETALDISTSSCILKDNVIVGGDINILRSKLNDGRFLSYLISNKKKIEIAKYAQGNSVVHLYNQHLTKILVCLPQVKEQNKIADFLLILDKKIQLQQEKIDALKLYNCGMNNIIFEKAKRYQLSKVKEFVFEYNVKTKTDQEYPILSSTSGGIKKQQEYFNKQTASESTIGYKIVPRGFFTYRSMSDTGEFFFNIQNVVDNGIVSPAYPVFATRNINTEYFNNYINSCRKFKNQILMSKSGGTRYALSFYNFKELEMRIPPQNVQDLYGKLIDAIKKKKAIEMLKLEMLVKLKKGLMQQLFV